MRRLLYLALIAFLTISISTCSDSGTGPDPDDGNSNNGGEETTTYTVSVTSSSSDAGTVSPSGENTYNEGEEVEIQADPNEGYVFTEWTGDIESTENPHSLTVDQDYDITADFEVKSYELTINKEGEGTVSEEVLEQKSKEYEHGTVVELTANPAEGYRFVEWQGDVTGSENPAEITIDDPKEVTAVFEKKSYALTINTEGEGAVSEEVVQQKSTDYEHGTVVELTANSAEGWIFKEWSGANTSSNNPIKITIDEPKEVTAIFGPKTFEVTIQTEGEGSVSKTPDQNSFEYNSSVELEAMPADGYQFVEWKGDISSTDNPYELTVTADTSITAVFEKQIFTLSVETSGEGSVTIDPDQTEYEYGTEVELLAEPNNSDWEFESWDGDTMSTDNPITIYVDSSITITGKFANTLFAGGAGTKENPYKISTVDQLQAINQYPTANYIQINDIDASETANWNSGKGFKPIGDDVIQFNGKYDGNGFNISNLTVSRESTINVGLFGYISSSTLENITVTNLNFLGKNTTGGLVGKSINSRILNSHVDGKVNAEYTTGGLVGFYGDGSIEKSSADVEVNTEWKNSGGLVGHHRNGTIHQSFSTNNVSGGLNVGGIIGLSNGGKITDSYALNNVSGTESVGGLIGRSFSETVTENSYSEGKVNGELYTGGLIGYNTGKVNNSYSKGDVVGTNRVGGLIGYNVDGYANEDNKQNFISGSYSEGDVTGIEDIGGLVGRNTSTIKDSFANGNIEGSNIRVGGLVGYHKYSPIYTSKFEGMVKGTNQIGGLVGYSERGDIIDSYTLGNISGENSIGGLAGAISSNEYNPGTVKFSFSAGSVKGSDEIGGLIGTFDGDITSSYWDTESTNQSNAVGRGNSDGTTGLTTSEMTGTSAEDNMSDFDWTEIWVTTDSYPALSWE